MSNNQELIGIGKSAIVYKLLLPDYFSDDCISYINIKQLKKKYNGILACKIFINENNNKNNTDIDIDKINREWDISFELYKIDPENRFTVYPILKCIDESIKFYMPLSGRHIGFLRDNIIYNIIKNNNVQEINKLFVNLRKGFVNFLNNLKSFYNSDLLFSHNDIHEKNITFTCNESYENFNFYLIDFADSSLLNLNGSDKEIYDFDSNNYNEIYTKIDDIIFDKDYEFNIFSDFNNILGVFYNEIFQPLLIKIQDIMLSDEINIKKKNIEFINIFKLYILNNGSKTLINNIEIKNQIIFLKEIQTEILNNPEIILDNPLLINELINNIIDIITDNFNNKKNKTINTEFMKLYQVFLKHKIYKLCIKTDFKKINLDNKETEKNFIKKIINILNLKKDSELENLILKNVKEFLFLEESIFHLLNENDLDKYTGRELKKDLNKRYNIILHPEFKYILNDFVTLYIENLKIKKKSKKKVKNKL